jgi:deoxycytidine triphosphate deaminase
LPEAKVTDEQELVSRQLGKRLAEGWAKNPKKLAIPDALLNSTDIRKVVEATGLISPFYFSNNKLKDRLKKAAYEGRIGSKAFIFKDKNCPELIFDSSKHNRLIVPKNSIVFVECDLDFRLPDFIALRFNLQIQHVHRGLLLGTGPLIDPGFWGKLCIPLHNLTDQDYEIPIEQGLIWIEFTKTSLPTDQADPAQPPLVGDTREADGYWDIEKFLHKAAEQFTGHKVPIKSSLPAMFEEATASAKKSAEDAKSALDEARTLRSLNTIAMVAAAIGLAALAMTAVGFLSSLSGRNEQIAGQLTKDSEAARRSLDEHISEVDRYGSTPNEARASVPALRGQVERQQVEIKALTDQVSKLKTELDRLKPKPRDPNRPAG